MPPYMSRPTVKVGVNICNIGLYVNEVQIVALIL